MAGKTFVPGEKLRAADMNNLQSKLDPYPDYELIGVQALSSSITSFDTSAGYNKFLFALTASAGTVITAVMTVNGDTSNVYAYEQHRGAADPQSSLSASSMPLPSIRENTTAKGTIEGGNSTGVKPFQYMGRTYVPTTWSEADVFGWYAGSASISSIQFRLGASVTGSVFLYGTQ